MFTQGQVTDSFTEATLPALYEAAQNGVIVIRASRTGSGMTVEGLAQWQEAGFVPTGTLNPAKARVLAQLLLTLERTTMDAVQVMRMEFAAY